MAWQLVTGVL